MRKELTVTEITEIENNEWIVFSTASDNKEPHAIVVIPSRVEKDKIILSNIQMKKSIENIKLNPKCFIDVYIKEQEDKQIKINGIGNIYDSGELFQEIKEFEETNNLSEDLKVNSIIVIKISNIEVSEG